MMSGGFGMAWSDAIFRSPQGLTPVFSVLTHGITGVLFYKGLEVPNRIIKETICTSEEIDMLSADEEVFFYRLMVVADDFGIMDARPAIIKARCYPLKSIDISSIHTMLIRLNNIGLIQMYIAGGKPYLRFTNWAKHQQIRAKRAKYPTIDEADEIIGNHLISNAPVIQSNPIQSESNPKATPEKPARFDAAKIDLPDCIPRETWGEWITYRRGRKLTVSEATMRKQVEALAGWCADGQNPGVIILTSIQNGWQGLFPQKDAQSRKGPEAKDPRYHFNTPEYRAEIAAQSEKYRKTCTPEQLAKADEDF